MSKPHIMKVGGVNWVCTDGITRAVSYRPALAYQAYLGLKMSREMAGKPYWLGDGMPALKAGIQGTTEPR